MTAPKEQLLNFCKQAVQQQIEAAQRGIAAADEAAKQETKGSAGDKYETGRAMLHLEKEQNIRRLNEALSNERILARIQPEHPCGEVVEGALVITNQGAYFFAIGAGKHALGKEEVLTLSIDSPLGEEMEGSTEGDVIQFRGRNFKILKIN